MQSIWVSADALSGCRDVAERMGFDVRQYLVRHGIDPDLIEHGRGVLSYHAICDCLEDIALSESCPDFGFQLGKYQSPLQFGIITQVLQFAPDVGEAIRIFLKYRDLYSQSSYWGMNLEGDIASLKRQELGRSNRRRSQLVALSVTRGFGAIRGLIGADWSPVAVYLSCERVPFVTSMVRHFGAPVFFNSPFDEIAFDVADLDRPIPTGNAEILAALTSYFDQLLPQLSKKGAMSAQVQRIVRDNLEQGRMSLDSVSAILGLHSRTLQRALTAEGTSFRALEQEARMLLASQMLENQGASMADIAVSTGYRHLSSLSRAYKRTQGSAPSRMRKSKTVIGHAIS